MNVLLISTYELGHQPFGLASPAAWLKEAGSTVTTVDLAVEMLEPETVMEADVVCFYVPMHTATRLAVPTARRIRELNPDAHLCFFGLYAPVNEELFREIGAGTVLGGEFEEGLVSMVRRLHKSDDPTIQSEPVLSLARQSFKTPDRSGLPALDRYAFITLTDGSRRVTGYTEATRGCKHTCRHCPVVPVYGGQFRVVPREIVLDDIAQQVAARAQHITFGDPDFLNGPGHAFRLVEELHQRWPDLTYDVTIKVQHLLKHADKLSLLRETGCVLVTSAVESVDDKHLEILDKHHTRADFFRAVALTREADLALNPTFVTFMPWTTVAGYLDLLAVIAQLDLVRNVSPIQYAIRLLIPAGSRLLDLPETQAVIEPFDKDSLVYPWTHPDPAVDRLYETVRQIVTDGHEEKASRETIFSQIWKATGEALDQERPRQSPKPSDTHAIRRPTVPYLSEPWYC
jgi:radical SAM superfamily enzyme YgiQ (UPF0313 family)